MPQSRKQNSATFTQPETIGLFGSRKDSFSQRYHLTRRGKLKRLAQIAQIVNQFDIVHGLTPIKMRLMFEALGPTFVKVGQILSMRSEILPQSFCDELSKLRADADPMAYGTVFRCLRTNTVVLLTRSSNISTPRRLDRQVLRRCIARNFPPARTWP